MISFSDLHGKTVLAKSDCSLVGKIKNVFFDEYCKKIAYFSTDGDTPLLIPPCDVKCVRDVVVLDDRIFLQTLGDVDATTLILAVGKCVYTPFGVSKGIITDCVFDEKGKIATFLTDSCEISPVEIKGVGDVVVLKENKKPRKKKVDFSSLASENVTVTALNTDDDSTKNSNSSGIGVESAPIFGGSVNLAKNESGIVVRSSTQSENENGGISLSPAEMENDGGAVIPQQTINVSVGSGFIPPRIIADYNFLLGRTLTNDLTTYAGELIANKNTFVTIDVVEKARANGKLLDLTLNSK